MTRSSVKLFLVLFGSLSLGCRENAEPVGSTVRENPLLDQADPVRISHNRATLRTSVQFPDIRDIKVSSDGSVWLLSRFLRRVRRLSPTLGEPVDFPVPELLAPEGLALAGNGELIITDEESKKVIRVTNRGVLVRWFGTNGVLDLTFHPHDAAIDENGFLYLSDRSQKRIAKFAPKGKFMFEAELASEPRKLASGGRYIYAASEQGVVVLNENLNLVETTDNENDFIGLEVDEVGYAGVGATRDGALSFLLQDGSSFLQSVEISGLFSVRDISFTTGAEGISVLLATSARLFQLFIPWTEHGEPEAVWARFLTELRNGDIERAGNILSVPSRMPFLEVFSPISDETSASFARMYSSFIVRKVRNETFALYQGVSLFSHEPFWVSFVRNDVNAPWELLRF